VQDPGEFRVSRESTVAGKHPHWELWRQDDNGIRMLIACFDDREAALAALTRFESQHHKQTYWIEGKASSGTKARPSGNP
jgi:hypothetical protein